MILAATILFWICLGGVAYAYVGYPLLLYVCARRFGRDRTAPPQRDERLPVVTLLVAAYNEAEVIGERIENALALDYPREKLDIVVASDGSDDGTNEIVERYADRGVRLLAFTPRRGKSTVLNDALPQSRGEVVVLSDANTMMASSAVRHLASWFQSPEVGAVTGKLELHDAATGKNVDGLYWRYENFLKRCEGRLGATLGANGAIYALRRDLYRPLPADTLIDDLTIPLAAKLATGCTIEYDSRAVANEETAPDVRAEFRRRARIGAGGFQAIARLKGLLHPRHGWTAWAFASHKIVRWCSPFFLLGMLATSAALAADPLYAVLLAGQIGFYAAALVGDRLAKFGPLGRLVRLAELFTAVNAALLVGFVRWLRKPASGAWVRTPRTASPST